MCVSCVVTSNIILGVGGTTGDPHFYGFMVTISTFIADVEGQYYTVMGQSYEVYNLITAPYLQINSHFNPYYKNAGQTAPTGTMIGDLGIKFHEGYQIVHQIHLPIDYQLTHPTFLQCLSLSERANFPFI